jgi:hypothetical protein
MAVLLVAQAVTTQTQGPFAPTDRYISGGDVGDHHGINSGICAAAGRQEFAVFQFKCCNTTDSGPKIDTKRSAQTAPEMLLSATA